MADQQLLKRLLLDVKRLLEHQEKIEQLKGERFNVFSILKMESKENETHSAFLAELLSPHGSHLKGNVFLKRFLEMIENTSLDIESAQVKVEHSIGARNDKAKLGGRIDIYIWDKNGESISIENKIYAGDQNAQIERYVNHHNGNNAVYYLTLDGKEPSKESKGKLKVDEDFYLLSYKSDILSWLAACVKESVEEPILRESIRQYAILIKKITKTMTDTATQNLIELMLDNYAESEFIASNFENAVNNVREKVRKGVIKLLKEKIGEEFHITSHKKINQNYAKIRIIPRRFPETNLHFGIESFSGKGHFNGRIFVGAVDRGAKTNEPSSYASQENVDKFSNWWMNIYKLEDFDGVEINLNDSKTMSRLSGKDDSYLNEFCSHICAEVEKYLSKEKEQLLNYLEVLES